MFESQEAELTSWGGFLLENLAWLLARYDFQIVVGSHSGGEENTFAETGKDSSWDLTLKRANRVREELQNHSGGDLNFRRVSGYGATQPVEGPNAEAGRTDPRIILSLSLTESQPLKQLNPELE